MKILDSVTGMEHMNVYVYEKKYVHLEPVGTDDWVITDDLKQLLDSYENVTIKDLFKYFGFITTISMDDAKKLIKQIENNFENKEV